ncbi:type II secretion system F family protein [Sulfurimonas autotrophica]|uniref:Type II secretion system F domain protein n=1 Tax=Sulfurimonas autotrophica (strain ATCC BAA-671 / DSM 16294 / JCM 11897 / OK10) TaxID=563040 RepID=E0UUY2_SULAO|nr:type II secretion system F family protein [Sulfurimonas autotrophica]ADN08494.1 Type II secretion system F domain protein [Sulfurimonas autotrophica DSM 16294]
MKYFRINYKIGKKKDSIVLEAENKISAMQNFYEMKIGVLIRIQEISKPLKIAFGQYVNKFKNPIKNKKVDTEKLIAILDQIAIMLDAGLPLNYVLAEAVKNQNDEMIKAIFTKINNDIEGGKSLYNSAITFKEQLGFITLSMFKLGEETGRLSESVSHLTSILQNIIDNRKKFQKATRYPLIIIFAMGIAFSVVIIFVVPQFKSFFQQSNMELPLPTQFLLWIEHALIVYGPYIIVSAVILSIFINILYKRSEKVRLYLDKLMLKIYILGKATLNAMISRFMYVFQVLVDAGIPMLEALNIASDIIENSYLKEKIKRISTSIEEGKSLYQGFEKTEVFENMIVEMIKAGEIGGGLDKMLNKITKIYKDRFDYIVDNIATLIEPILIAAIAGFVMVLALGIFLPMWNMVDLAK